MFFGGAILWLWGFLVLWGSEVLKVCEVFKTFKVFEAFQVFEIFHVFEIWRDQNGQFVVLWDYIRWASRLHHNPRLVTTPVGITCNPKNGRPRGSDSGVPLMLVAALSGLW